MELSTHRSGFSERFAENLTCLPAVEIMPLGRLAAEVKVEAEAERGYDGPHLSLGLSLDLSLSRGYPAR